MEGLHPLHQADVVWRRPRPVLKRRDPERETKLQKLRMLLLSMPEDETVVFEDEGDLNLNPKIGSMWMLQGPQGEGVQPGDKGKGYAAGCANWRSGNTAS